MTWKDFIWPVIGLLAVAVSAWLLYHELRGISLDDVWDGLVAIPMRGWLLSALAAIAAYAALAGYDHIALLHIGKKVSWPFVTACSFTTYALAHNIGGSVVSGAVIRYRAYVSRGLTGQEVGVLVAICLFTFLLSTVVVGAVVLILKPELMSRFADSDLISFNFGRAAGFLLLALVIAYIFGSWLHLKPLKIKSFQIHYPALPIVTRQLIIGPLEIVAAASIIYFVLPAEGNPGFLIILGIFLVSFSAALISHAPGGLGVFEVVFLIGLPEMDPASVLAALLVFRLFYLLIPFAIALLLVLVFERSQFGRRNRV
ncbi:lysylphosphatidylglycerol synthase domain-containing protein [Mesorhizobium sp. SB112]|uniref:lysylphosphatidylglycerol synthase domain-containing protein n=1 Tax=Mesorhizobium sp. SB112 TaxID=3151853 RepID=UPI0032676607